MPVFCSWPTRATPKDAGATEPSPPPWTFMSTPSPAFASSSSSTANNRPWNANPESPLRLRPKRRVSCRDSRTRLDWAEEVRRLLEEDYPQAQKVTLVCDNLNTHHFGSLYAALPAEQAHRLARRLEIHYTPRSGSWLNAAEIEWSVLARQCLKRRIATREELLAETEAWQRQRNVDGSRVHWRFTTADARIKLSHLYPQC
jgi:hypothetical protein